MAIDEGVGRLMKTLRETGQLENTLVVYTADQGFSLGQHGLNQKVAPYDAAIASPLILYHTGKLVAGKFCKHPVNAPDLVRYFCTVAGVNVPWKMHGRDIRPLLANPETEDWHQPMIMTHTGRTYGDDTSAIPVDESMYVVGGVPWYVLLRDGRYKYIRYLLEGETEELYDLDADPEELKNLAKLPEQKQRLVKLRALAIAELKNTGAKFADHLPETAAMKDAAPNASK
jgi:arylsulfatase A-like enzyme